MGGEPVSKAVADSRLPGPNIGVKIMLLDISAAATHRYENIDASSTIPRPKRVSDKQHC